MNGTSASTRPPRPARGSRVQEALARMRLAWAACPTQAPHGFERVDYRVLRTSDVHRHAESIRHWSQQYDQISKGRFNGRLREVWVDQPRVQIFHEYTEPLTFQRCLPWPGSIWFGIPNAAEPAGLGFCGRAMEQRQPVLMSARRGESFNLRTPRSFGIYGVLLDESDWLARLGQDTSNALAGPSLLAMPLTPEHHRALRHAIEMVLRLGEAGESGLPGSRSVMAVLLDHVLNLLGSATRAGPTQTQRRSSRNRLEVVVRARELALQSADVDEPEGLRLERLCERLHVTRRTLQNYCREVVGESPADFLKAVRLNACRRALQSGQSRATVRDVAWRWGFRHMGHFSQDYKDMFGELPSQTRQTPWRGALDG